MFLGEGYLFDGRIEGRGEILGLKVNFVGFWAGDEGVGFSRGRWGLACGLWFFFVKVK